MHHLSVYWRHTQRLARHLSKETNHVLHAGPTIHTMLPAFECSQCLFQAVSHILDHWLPLLLHVLLTVCSEGHIHPVITGHARARAARTARGALISVPSRVPRWEVINTLLWRNFRAGMCTHLCLSNYDSSLVDQILDDARGLRLGSVQFSVRATSQSRLYATEMIIVLDRDPEPVERLGSTDRKVQP